MKASQAEYDPVSDDGYESKTCFAEDDFKAGINFPTQLVGKTEVSRPNTRSEIVGAMRKIRYESKARGVEKRRVILSISVDGIAILVKRRSSGVRWWRERKCALLEHPLQRVFYVSHDSQDLKIFSYIAREPNGEFVCVVFKARRNAQAMRIVGTIGQAFEVCHKFLSLHPSVASSPTSSPQLCTKPSIDIFDIPGDSSSSRVQQRPLGPSGSLQIIAESGAEQRVAVRKSPSLHSPLAHHNLHIARHERELHCQEGQAALAQVRFLKDRLTAETSARVEAQARVEHLLQHNRQLIDQLTSLAAKVRILETEPCHKQMSEGDEFVVSHEEKDEKDQRGSAPVSRIFANFSFECAEAPVLNGSASPDSGHKEMSSDSLAQQLHRWMEAEVTPPRIDPPPPTRRRTQRSLTRDPEG